MLKPLIKYWLPALLYAILIFCISSVPGSAIPEDLILPDYFLHSLIYLPFGFLVYQAAKNTKSKFSAGRIFYFSILLVALYAASDEFHQLFVPGRYASLLDLLGDIVGAGIGMRIVL